MVQNHEATGGGQGFKQFIVAPGPRRRLNARVGFVD
jgi:hypothetical protein